MRLANLCRRIIHRSCSECSVFENAMTYVSSTTEEITLQCQYCECLECCTDPSSGNVVFPGRYSQTCAPSNTLCCVMPHASLPQCITVQGQGFCCTEADSCYMDGPSVCGQKDAVSCGQGSNACCPSSTSCLTGFNQTSSQVRCLLNPLFIPALVTTTRVGMSSFITKTTVTGSDGSTITADANVAPTGSGLITEAGTTISSTFIGDTTVFSGTTDATTTVPAMTVANTWVPLTPNTSVNPNKGTQTTLPTGPSVGIAVGSVAIFSLVVFIGWRFARDPRHASNGVFHQPKRHFSLMSHRKKSSLPGKDIDARSSDLESKVGKSYLELGQMNASDPYLSPGGKFPEPHMSPGAKY